MAAVSGKLLRIVIVVRPSPASAIVTSTRINGMSVLGRPSAFEKPSRNSSRCGRSTEVTSQ